MVGNKIKLMYFELLKSIVTSDFNKIGKLCEKNLYREFFSSIQWISPQVKKLELINQENFDQDDKDFIKIEVIDFF